MADDDAQNQEREEGLFYGPSATSGLNRLIRALIYVALGAVGLVLMSVIAYYVARTAAARQYKEVSSITVVKPPPPTENFNFSKEFRVNTADEGATRFVRLELSLGFETGNPVLSAELAQRVPQLRNIVNLVLAGKSSQNLVTIEDRLELQEELKASINHIMSNGKITEVYFRELIVN